ncbi:hypothetical protein J2R76_003691 [Bradyrhizobium sp. USDA 4532]|nr:hypothetical protein [Bradyrhizobium sp. USDA 4545]MCP1920100.1 hypothetical protein [Bradyrhizobium sp. USDA 4532]
MGSGASCHAFPLWVANGRSVRRRAFERATAPQWKDAPPAKARVSRWLAVSILKGHLHSARRNRVGRSLEIGTGHYATVQLHPAPHNRKCDCATADKASSQLRSSGVISRAPCSTRTISTPLGNAS